MLPPRILVVLAIVLGLVNCESGGRNESFSAPPTVPKPADRRAPVNPQIPPGPGAAVREVSLPDGLCLQLRKAEELEDFVLFSSLTLLKDGRVLVRDTSADYELNEKFYPILLRNPAGGHDLLVEVNGRPGMSRGRVFRIRGGKLAGQHDVPVFVAPAANLDQDPALEFAGYGSFFETWEEPSGQPVTSYNPLLFYEHTARGLQLDSALTREVNQRIYGQFHGFAFREDLPQPVSIVGRLDDEVAQVKHRAARPQPPTKQ
ncbi:hypothetical protein [Hymenobacter cellulosivorans]|uniref:DUF4369 domain-containing protein n=1 Tax=Hymenobacter cellulosivorans TaxID=2932249 RepID=A0ABY4F4U3_9BACT|nr:hypothetical protein [Hymenobacter cellulosivorans]UOQ51685.1 hypothetical protein MUN80_18200 [Hymenobacter cellulosivorans]